jgi:hypothetical protein
MSQEYSMGLQELARLPDVSAHNEPGALRAHQRRSVAAPAMT